MKIAPALAFNDVHDATPAETYGYLVSAIGPLGLAYLHVAAQGEAAAHHARLRPRFPGTYLAGGGHTRESGEAALRRGEADAIVFGTPFISNPDLPERFRRDVPLTRAERSTFYSPGPEGYIDYPAAS
jgi:N-ethylmaleimide reductase